MWYNYFATLLFQFIVFRYCSFDRYENGEVTIDFDTPWCCPHGWLETLGKKKIPFYLEWIEEQGYHGEVYSDGETVVYKDLPDLTWDEDKEEYVEYKEDDE